MYNMYYLKNSVKIILYNKFVSCPVGLIFLATPKQKLNLEYLIAKNHYLRDYV